MYIGHLTNLDINQGWLNDKLCQLFENQKLHIKFCAQHRISPPRMQNLYFFRHFMPLRLKLPQYFSLPCCKAYGHIH